MAFVFPNRFDGSAHISGEKLDANFRAFENKVNGNLTTENIVQDTFWGISYLATNQFEIILSLSIPGTATANEGLNCLGIGGGTPAMYVVGAVPYDSGGAAGGVTNYTILSVDHMFTLGTGAPTTSTVFSLLWGHVNGGAWATTSTIETPITVPTATGQTHYAGTALNEDSIQVVNANPMALILQCQTQGVGYNDGDSWCISIKIARNNGVRG